MSSETPQVKRRPAWHPATIAGAMHPGKRPADPEIRWKVATAKATAKWTAAGVAMYFGAQSMGWVGDLLKEQTKTLRELPGAVAAAIKERGEADRGDAAWLAAEMQSLRAETAQHQAADAIQFSRLEGIVSGRSKCLPCPACPACPPVIGPAPTTRGPVPGGSSKP